MVFTAIGLSGYNFYVSEGVNTATLRIKND